MEDGWDVDQLLDEGIADAAQHLSLARLNRFRFPFVPVHDRALARRHTWMWRKACASYEYSVIWQEEEGKDVEPDVSRSRSISPCSSAPSDILPPKSTKWSQPDRGWAFPTEPEPLTPTAARAPSHAKFPSLVGLRERGLFDMGGSFPSSCRNGTLALSSRIPGDAPAASVRSLLSAEAFLDSCALSADAFESDGHESSRLSSWSASAMEAAHMLHGPETVCLSSVDCQDADSLDIETNFGSSKGLTDSDAASDLASKFVSDCESEAPDVLIL